MNPVLEVKDLKTFYGKIQAVKGISLTVKQGEIVALLGANGAGKSTILKTISGLVRPSVGSVSFNGENITTTEAHVIAEKGLIHVPEGRRVFGALTVTENLELGAFTKKGDKAKTTQKIAMVFDMFPRLAERHKQMAGTLSGGEQQMLAIGRALMAEPKLLMLDEPSMGLAPIIVIEIMKIIKTINEQNKTTILLVEQNAKAALKLAHRGYVLETGTITMEESSEALRSNDNIVKAYLGAH
ncbi:ABC transporter ATP-binding protein [Paenibacillus sp. SYP-B3998]|uniref:ABC transporter ATP-binding protein n=1 Tax=Paenibacillus sp. SYP-B3998 TaxID=2678564 RepID=A0A6G4A4V4_9BACL|nr:ABC transporter ATP-binding protein [Paenibacillus sp. SYP-B3998]NEW08974.1 ABC transporter ATP-binding protein [Paenibacillus sp. SYP-B3998]